jgi:hypothetical protein
VFHPKLQDQADTLGKPDGPLFGRKRELDTIMARVRSLQEASIGGVIMVEGEAGMGKTRLVQEVVSLLPSLPQAPLATAHLISTPSRAILTNNNIVSSTMPHLTSPTTNTVSSSPAASSVNPPANVINPIASPLHTPLVPPGGRPSTLAGGQHSSSGADSLTLPSAASNAGVATSSPGGAQQGTSLFVNTSTAPPMNGSHSARGRHSPPHRPGGGSATLRPMDKVLAESRASSSLDEPPSPTGSLERRPITSVSAQPMNGNDGSTTNARGRMFIHSHKSSIDDGRLAEMLRTSSMNMSPPPIDHHRERAGTIVSQQYNDGKSILSVAAINAGTMENSGMRVLGGSGAGGGHRGLHRRNTSSMVHRPIRYKFGVAHGMSAKTPYGIWRTLVCQLLEENNLDTLSPNPPSASVPATTTPTAGNRTGPSNTPHRSSIRTASAATVSGMPGTATELETKRPLLLPGQTSHDGNGNEPVNATTTTAGTPKHMNGITTATTASVTVTSPSGILSSPLPPPIDVVSSPSVAATAASSALDRLSKADGTIISTTTTTTSPVRFGRHGRTISMDNDTRERWTTRMRVCGVPDDEMCLLNWFTNLRLPDTPLTKEMSKADRTRRINTIIVHLLKLNLHKHGPYLLILENVQWIDSYSWTLLAHLSVRVDAGVLLLLTMRTSVRASAHYRRLLSLAHTIVVDLAPLGVPDVERLLLAEIRAPSIPSDFVLMMNAVAHGNPLFLRDLLKSLALNPSQPNDKRTLSRANSQQSLNDGGSPTNSQRNNGALVRRSSSPDGSNAVIALSSPDMFSQLARKLSLTPSIQQIMTSRIDRLSPLQQEILKTAAVVGVEFTFSVVSTVCGLSGTPTEVVEESLQQFERFGFIAVSRAVVNEPSTSAPKPNGISTPTNKIGALSSPSPNVDPTARFRHAAMQEVAYKLLSAADREALHLRIAESMEASELSRDSSILTSARFLPAARKGITTTTTTGGGGSSDAADIATTVATPSAASAGTSLNTGRSTIGGSENNDDEKDEDLFTLQPSDAVVTEIEDAMRYCGRIAHHFQAGGQLLRAICYYHLAAQLASRLSLAQSAAATESLEYLSQLAMIAASPLEFVTVIPTSPHHESSPRAATVASLDAEPPPAGGASKAHPSSHHMLSAASSMVSNSTPLSPTTTTATINHTMMNGMLSPTSVPSLRSTPSRGGPAPLSNGTAPSTDVTTSLASPPNIVTGDASPLHTATRPSSRGGMVQFALSGTSSPARARSPDNLTVATGNNNGLSAHPSDVTSGGVTPARSITPPLPASALPLQSQPSGGNRLGLHTPPGSSGGGSGTNSSHTTTLPGGYLMDSLSLAKWERNLAEVQLSVGTSRTSAYPHMRAALTHLSLPPPSSESILSDSKQLVAKDAADAYFSRASNVIDSNNTGNSNEIWLEIAFLFRVMADYARANKNPSASVFQSILSVTAAQKATREPVSIRLIAAGYGAILNGSLLLSQPALGRTFYTAAEILLAEIRQLNNRRISQCEEIGLLYDSMAGVDMALGRWEVARGHLEEAYQVHFQNDSSSLLDSLCSLALMCRWMGLLDRSTTLFCRLQELAADQGSQRFLSRAILGSAENMILAGRFHEATDELREKQRRTPVEPDVTIAIRTKTCLAWAAWSLGSRKGVSMALDALAMITSTVHLTRNLLESLGALCQIVCLAAWRKRRPSNTKIVEKRKNSSKPKSTPKGNKVAPIIVVTTRGGPGPSSVASNPFSDGDFDPEIDIATLTSAVDTAVSLLQSLALNFPIARSRSLIYLGAQSLIKDGPHGACMSRWNEAIEAAKQANLPRQQAVSLYWQSHAPPHVPTSWFACCGTSNTTTSKQTEWLLQRRTEAEHLLRAHGISLCTVDPEWGGSPAPGSGGSGHGAGGRFEHSLLSTYVASGLYFSERHDPLVPDENDVLDENREREPSPPAPMRVYLDPPTASGATGVHHEISIVGRPSLPPPAGLVYGTASTKFSAAHIMAAANGHSTALLSDPTVPPLARVASPMGMSSPPGSPSPVFGSIRQMNSMGLSSLHGLDPDDHRERGVLKPFDEKDEKNNKQPSPSPRLPGGISSTPTNHIALGISSARVPSAGNSRRRSLVRQPSAPGPSALMNGTGGGIISGAAVRLQPISKIDSVDSLLMERKMLPFMGSNAGTAVLAHNITNAAGPAFLPSTASPPAFGHNATFSTFAGLGTFSGMSGGAVPTPFGVPQSSPSAATAGALSPHAASTSGGASERIVLGPSATRRSSGRHGNNTTSDRLGDRRDSKRSTVVPMNAIAASATGNEDSPASHQLVVRRGSGSRSDIPSRGRRGSGNQPLMINTGLASPPPVHTGLGGVLLRRGGGGGALSALNINAGDINNLPTPTRTLSAAMTYQHNSPEPLLQFLDDSFTNSATPSEIHETKMRWLDLLPKQIMFQLLCSPMTDAPLPRGGLPVPPASAMSAALVTSMTTELEGALLGIHFQLAPDLTATDGATHFSLLSAFLDCVFRQALRFDGRLVSCSPEHVILLWECSHISLFSACKAAESCALALAVALQQYTEGKCPFRVRFVIAGGNVVAIQGPGVQSSPRSFLLFGTPVRDAQYASWSRTDGDPPSPEISTLRKLDRGHGGSTGSSGGNSSAITRRRRGSGSGMTLGVPSNGINVDSTTSSVSPSPPGDFRILTTNSSPDPDTAAELEHDPRTGRSLPITSSSIALTSGESDAPLTPLPLSTIPIVNGSLSPQPPSSMPRLVGLGSSRSSSGMLAPPSPSPSSPGVLAPAQPSPSLSYRLVRGGIEYCGPAMTLLEHSSHSSSITNAGKRVAARVRGAVQLVKAVNRIARGFGFARPPSYGNAADLLKPPAGSSSSSTGTTGGASSSSSTSHVEYTLPDGMHGVVRNSEVLERLGGFGAASKVIMNTLQQYIPRLHSSEVVHMEGSLCCAIVHLHLYRDHRPLPLNASTTPQLRRVMLTTRAALALFPSAHSLLAAHGEALELTVVHRSSLKILRFCLLLVAALQTQPDVRISIGIGTGPCSVRSLSPHQSNMWSILGRAHNRARHALDRASIVTVEKRHFQFPPAPAQSAVIPGTSTPIASSSKGGIFASAPPSPVADSGPTLILPSSGSVTEPNSPSKPSQPSRTHLVILDAETHNQTSTHASSIPFTGLPVSKSKADRKRKGNSNGGSGSSTHHSHHSHHSHQASLISMPSTPGSTSSAASSEEPLLETATSFYRLVGIRDSSKNRESRLCGRFIQLSQLDTRLPPAQSAFVSRTASSSSSTSRHGRINAGATTPSLLATSMGVALIVQGVDGGGKSSLLSLFAHLAHHRIHQDEQSRIFGRSRGGDPTTPSPVPTPASTGAAVAAALATTNAFPSDLNTPSTASSTSSVSQRSSGAFTVTPKAATATTATTNTGNVESPKVAPISAPLAPVAGRRVIGGGLTLITNNAPQVAPSYSLSVETKSPSPTLRLTPSISTSPSTFALPPSALTLISSPSMAGASGSPSPPLASSPLSATVPTSSSQRSCVFTAQLTKPDQFTPWFTIRALLRVMLENECSVSKEFSFNGTNIMMAKFTRYYPFLAPYLHLMNQFMPAHLLRFTPPTIGIGARATAMTDLLDENNASNRLDLLLKLIGAFFALFFEGRRAVLVVQNGDLMDTSSASALRVIVSTIPSCMAVVSAPPSSSANETQAASPLKALDRLNPEIITLEPLTYEETRCMVMSYLGALDVPAQFVNAVVERTKGHPRTIATFCQMLRKRGFMRDETTGATLSFDVRTVRCHFKMGKPLSMVGLNGTAMGAMLPGALGTPLGLDGKRTLQLAALNPKVAGRVGLAPVALPGGGTSGTGKITLGGLGLGNSSSSSFAASFGVGGTSGGPNSANTALVNEWLDTADGVGTTGSQQIILTVLAAIGTKASPQAIAAIHPGNPAEPSAMTAENKTVRDLRSQATSSSIDAITAGALLGSGTAPSSPTSSTAGPRVPSSPSSSSLSRLAAEHGIVTLTGVRSDLAQLVQLDLLEEAAADAAGVSGTATAAVAAISTPRNGRGTLGLGRSGSINNMALLLNTAATTGTIGLPSASSSSSPNNDRSYAFVQEAMREQIYSRISGGWRTRLHERIALFYEKLYKVQMSNAVSDANKDQSVCHFRLCVIYEILLMYVVFGMK